MSTGVIGKWRLKARELVLIVAVLTVLDVLLTLIGLRFRYLLELNPLMCHVLENGWLTVLLMLYLLLLFALLYRCAGRVKWLGGAMLALLAVKLAIMVQHMAVIIRAIIDSI